MYIFVNMFVSLIYDTFRYVFHHGKANIMAKDITMFRMAWLQFDPHGTGYIDPGDLHKLLHSSQRYFFHDHLQW